MNVLSKEIFSSLKADEKNSPQANIAYAEGKLHVPRRDWMKK